MKFENVNVDDIVYTQRNVRYGWNSSELFFVPEKITRVTKTQFVVESGDRYRKDGSQYGDSWTKAYLKGEDAGYYSLKRIVDDETEKMKCFVLKISTERQINKTLESLGIEINSDFNLDQLSEINILITKLVSKLKPLEDEN